jgi:hypothetical protein
VVKLIKKRTKARTEYRPQGLECIPRSLMHIHDQARAQVRIRAQLFVCLFCFFYFWVSFSGFLNYIYLMYIAQYFVIYSEMIIYQINMSYHRTVFWVCRVRTPKIYSVGKFPSHNTMLLTMVHILCSRFYTYNLCNGNFVPFDLYLSISMPHSPSLVTIVLLCFYILTLF